MAVGSPTMVSGVRSLNDFVSGREDDDYETGIALLDPNENPATAAIMVMGKETSANITYHYYEDELVPEVDTINNASDDYDASSTAIVVDNITRWAVGDLAMENLSREVMLVTAVDATNSKLTVTRDYGSAEGWTELDGSMADGSYLTIIGNAFQPGHTLPTIRSTKEVEYKNYTQDMRTPIGISEVAEDSRLHGEDDWPYQERKAGISHMRKEEYINWWGKPYVGDKKNFSSHGPTTSLPATAGGINHYIAAYAPSNQKLDESELTQDEFQDFMEYVFEYGSGLKYCYCAPRLRTALDKWGISKLNTFSSDSVFGMAVSRWVSSHGEVVFITHKMFKNPEATDYLYNFFLDMEKLKRITKGSIGSTRLRELDPYKATGATLMEKEFQSIQCTKIGLPPAHARLRFKTIGA